MGEMNWMRVGQILERMLAICQGILTAESEEEYLDRVRQFELTAATLLHDTLVAKKEVSGDQHDNGC